MKLGIEDMDDILGVEIEEESAKNAGSERTRKPYKEATVRPDTRLQASVTEESLFDMDDMMDKVALSQLYPSQTEVLDLKGTNELNCISTFSGCGGSATGFAWAGWDEMMAVEFVDSARQTFSLNYPSFVIEPTEVFEVARLTAKRMGIEHLLVSEQSRTVRGKVSPSTLNWMNTLSSMDETQAADFRRETCREVFGRKSPGKMPIWGDDVRGLDTNAMMEHLGIQKGELDCVEGSPPCLSFSTSGLRERGWGETLHYSDERFQRTDDLFEEYLRMIDGLRPRSFVAENVAGMGMGSAETEKMVPLINAFSGLGYRVEAHVLNSRNYGVPQSRPRMFFQAIRDDQYLPDGRPAHPSWPDMVSTAYTCQEAIDAARQYNTQEQLDWVDLTNYETGKIWKTLPPGGSPENKAYQLQRCHPGLPVPTITATSSGNQPAAGPTHPHECRKFTIPEYRYLCSFPYDYTFTGTIDQQGERMGRSVPPYLMKQLAQSLSGVLNVSSSR